MPPEWFGRKLADAILTIIALVVVLGLMVQEVAAQAPCVPMEQLPEVVGEMDMSQVAAPSVDMGDRGMRGAVVYANPEGRWIMVALGANGLACIALHGNDWWNFWSPDEGA